MAFENPEPKICDGKKKVDAKQFETVLKLNLDEGKNVKRVISVHATSKLLSNEKVENNLNFSGRINYNVVYENEDGKLQSAVADAEFQQNMQYFYGELFYIDLSVLENTVVSFSVNQIDISSLVNVDVYSIVSEKINSVENLSENYVVKNSNFEYQRFVNMISQNLNEVCEIEYQNKVEQVLSSDAEVVIKSVTPNIDSAIIEGKICFTTYLLADDNIDVVNKDIDFKQEVSLPSVVPNNKIDALIKLSGLKCTATVNEIDQKTTLIVAVDMCANLIAYSIDNITVVEDLFSTNKEIQVVNECVAQNTFIENKYYSFNVLDEFSLQREDIDKLLFVTNTSVSLTDKVKQGDVCKISGVIETDVVAQTENKEYIKLNGVIPFEQVVDDINQEFNLTAKVLSIRLHGQKTVEVSLNLNAVSYKTKNDYINFVSSIEEGENKTLSDAAIRVYVTSKNEDLFSVAKTISVKPEIITMQNPNISEELVEGTRLIVYSPLNVDF